MNVLLVSDDLMFGSQVASALGDVALQRVDGTDEALRAASVDWLIVDLNTCQDVAALAKQGIERWPDVRLIAVGPHVHRERLAGAAKAGWEVFTRGQLVQGALRRADTT